MSEPKAMGPESAATHGVSKPSTSHSRKPPAGATVEWDQRGRVTKACFSNGHSCQFRYDQQGKLCSFTYGGLAWSTTDGARWTAVDQDHTYVLDGTVDVAVDGTIRIERLDICRRIRLNGSITDQMSDGATVESEVAAIEQGAADLLAVGKPKISEATRYRSASDAVAAASGTPVEPMPAIEISGRQQAISGSMPAAPDALSPRTSQRKLIAQGVRINRMREMFDDDVASAPPASATMNNSFQRWWINVKIRLLQVMNGAEDVSIAPSIDALAFMAHAERRVDEARMLHERALQLRRRALGPNCPEIGVSMFGLGKIYHDWGRVNEAEQYYLQAIKLFEYGLKKSRFLYGMRSIPARLVADNLARTVSALQALASLYFEQQQKDLCRQLHETAQRACQSVSGPYPATIDGAVQSMGILVTQLDAINRKSTAELRTSRWERHSGV